MKTSSIQKIRIGNTDIFLEDMGEGKGKITVSDTYGYNYSMYWGAMEGTLSEFIKRINSDYFANKLSGAADSQVFSSKLTFRELRKHIRTEILPWYKHMEFQKDMREKINDFEQECESEEGFVNSWPWFIRGLNYYLIDNRFDRENIEDEFKSIIEPWHFIHTEESPAYKWLKNLHIKLKKQL